MGTGGPSSTSLTCDIGKSAPTPHMSWMTQPTTLERAFALARSGSCATVQEIRKRLKSEGFDQVDAHLAGPALAKQLRRLCDEARSAAPETAGD